jgi:uncharacterized protein YdiU (UPF0061 family)
LGLGVCGKKPEAVCGLTAALTGCCRTAYSRNADGRRMLHGFP